MRLNSLLVLILIFSISNLHAQPKGTTEKWMGIGNLFFKSKDKNATRTAQPNSTVLISNELLDHQFSIGFYFRKINKKKIYQQFDFFEIGWEKDRRVTEIHNNLNSDLRGTEFKKFNALIGYQRGKLFPITQNLNGDIGIRGFAWYEKTHNIPLDQQGFPLRTTSIGLGLNLVLGLNYQVHKRINIGYNFAPITARVFRNNEYIDNPILTKERRSTKAIAFKSDFFESVLGLRNINISYVFE